MSPMNDQLRLAARPKGLPDEGCWSRTQEPVGEPQPGGVIAQAIYLSLDPAMRGWMNEGKSYIPPVGLGEVMRAGGVGRVIASSCAALPVGAAVGGMFGVQRYASFSAEQVEKRVVYPIDLRLGRWTQWLNTLGMPGMTAYFGLKEVGLAKAGETLVVSGAAGAVGQTAGQLAKLLGMRAVGIAGGPEKCERVVRELGFDACLDYKAGGLKDGLSRACPEGVDVYFDNVGGEILDTLLTRIKRHARIVLCGAISQYNSPTGMQGPKNYMSLLVNRARMEGFVVFDYAARYGQAVQELAGYLGAGRMKSIEDVERGLERFPEVLLHLFAGKNFGKLVLQVADES